MIIFSNCYLLVCLLITISCSDSTNKALVEKKALEFLISEIVPNDDFFDNSNISISRKLEAFTEEEVHLQNCEKIINGAYELVFLEGKKISIIQYWNDKPYELDLLKIQIPESIGFDPLSVVIYRKVLIEDKTFLVQIDCYKADAKGKEFHKIFFFFINNAMIINDWCAITLMDYGYNG
jgi:hypothetical protein